MKYLNSMHRLWYFPRNGCNTPPKSPRIKMETPWRRSNNFIIVYNEKILNPTLLPASHVIASTPHCTLNTLVWSKIELLIRVASAPALLPIIPNLTLQWNPVVPSHDWCLHEGGEKLRTRWLARSIISILIQVRVVFAAAAVK